MERRNMDRRRPRRHARMFVKGSASPPATPARPEAARSNMTTIFPDIADILARKERGRAELAKLSFEEKLEILDRLRENETALGRVMRESAGPRLAAEQP